MTPFAPSAAGVPRLADPAYLQIEDRLDAIGQKYRVQKILRGALLWVGLAILATLAAALAAHFVGAGFRAKLALGAWAAWMIGSAAWWLVRPLLVHPDPVQVARLVESRVGGLHNGLTNSLLLARREDLAHSPWLPHIYDEIATAARTAPLSEAVKIRDLRPLTLRLGAALLVALLAAVFIRRPLRHGWQQMFSPTQFVPSIGAAEITDVKPGDTRVVTGQALDLTVLAEAPKALGQPPMKVVFEAAEGHDSAAAPASQPADAAAAPVVPVPQGGEVLPGNADDVEGRPGKVALRYTYHVDHLGRPLRYRVEVAGTQSRWYSADVIKKVELAELALRVAPPLYVGQEAREIHLKKEDLGKTPVVVPQGSRVEVRAIVDVAVGGAILQAGEGTAAATPIPMTAGLQGRQFTAALTVLQDTPVSVLLTDNAGQVLFKVPDEAFVVACTKDGSPVVQLKWPAQDVSAPPASALRIVASLKDDYGLASARVLMSADDPAAPKGAQPAQSAEPVAGEAGDKNALTVATEIQYAPGTKAAELSFALPVKPELRKHGNVVRVQVEATDNRDLGPAARAALLAQLQSAKDPKANDPKALDALIGPQTTSSAVYQIKFLDASEIAKEEKEKGDELRRMLREMLDAQKALHDQAVAAKPADHEAFKKINAGQVALRATMKQTAETFKFEPDDRVVQKALLMLVIEPAREAADFSALLASEPAPAAQRKEDDELQGRQRRIVSTLESLLALLAHIAEPTTQPTTRRGGDLLSKAEEMRKLDEALKQFMKEQQRVLDQTAGLAKKPVDNFDDADKKKMDELAMAQEKLDAFMQEKVHDFSKLAEQDMSNASMLKELYEIYSEVTMAKDALKQKAAEVAVAAEDNGLELAKEQSSNIEKWLSNAPDRAKWTQEDPLDKKDIPMPELPKELEDMVGKLLEQEEDLFDEMEDQNANWTDSMDKGVGWDAADGPIADMSAKGVTGNQLPNNNEMGGRSGEGRSGRSQGEMVDDTAKGKGGRRTPTRLDPTPFQKGQVKDESKDPTGGATGGGKLSGQGGQGLEGPVGPKLKQEMQRLAQKQAQLRNEAERLNLQYQLGRYDNFKLTEATGVMRRVESDLNANRYQNALRRRDLLVDSMDTSRLLLGSEVHVKQDTTPTASSKTRRDLNDAMKGELPPAWSDALKEYYRKLSEE